MCHRSYIDGFISSECTDIPAEMLPPNKTAAQAGYCLGEWSWSYTHIISLFASMYIWELVHEGSMIHLPLAAHHLSIIALLQLIVGYYATRDWITLVQLKAISDIGFGQLLAAGLEQPTFVALLLHRFGFSLPTRVRAFNIAWISFFVTKAIAFVYTIVMLIVFWDETPVSYLIVMTVLLLVVSATQFYSILVLRMLAVSVLLALTTLLPPSHPLQPG